MIKESQVVLHEADQPDLVADLLDADVLTGEDSTEVYLALANAEAPATRDGDGPVVERVRQLADPAIGTWRRAVELGGILHRERLVRSVMVIAIDKVIELRLLLQEILRGRLGRFLFQGQVHTLVATILLGMTGFDALDADAEA